MVKRSGAFSVFILLACIAVVGFFIWNKINPNLNIETEILTGSVTGIIIIIVGIVLVISFIRMLRGK